MNDRRIAEWLSVDDTLGEGPDDAGIEAGGGERGEASRSVDAQTSRSVDAQASSSVDAQAASRSVDAQASPAIDAEPGARAWASSRSRPTPHRRSGMVVGFEQQQAHILELIEAVARRIRRRPLAALVVGAGVGFVIGGALSCRMGRLLLAAGARHVTRELLKQLL
jgi:ElaB/YqjD/DUF883 family membrane-anchored ribosome-binding protein